jgi:hypothetical protein
VTKQQIGKKYIKIRKLWGKWQTILVIDQQSFYIDTTANTKGEAQVWGILLATALERMIREVTK